MARLQHEIAHMPVAQPAVSAEPARQQPTDRRCIVGRIERDHLAGLRQVRAQLADGCGRAAPHSHLGGFVLPHARWCPQLARSGCRFAAHLPMRARAHHRDRPAGADLAGECRHLRSNVRSQACIDCSGSDARIRGWRSTGNAAVRVHTHAPSGTCWRNESLQREPDGITFSGLANPSGSNVSRTRSWVYMS